jgi:hypothetical protein
VTDQLRRRLRAMDPVPPTTPVEPADSPGTRALVGAIMQTQPQTPIQPPAPEHRPRWLPILAGAAVVAAVAVGGVLLVNRPDAPAGGDALELALPATDTMGMCVPFSVDVLADMSPAFAGTAVDVSGNRVVLDVERWYTGGDAAQVVLNAPPSGVLLGGQIDFREGERYLITAAEGTVNVCGFSGEATPELEAAFEQAF